MTKLCPTSGSGSGSVQLSKQVGYIMHKNYHSRWMQYCSDQHSLVLSCEFDQYQCYF